MNLTSGPSQWAWLNYKSIVINWVQLHRCRVRSYSSGRIGSINSGMRESKGTGSCCLSAVSSTVKWTPGIYHRLFYLVLVILIFSCCPTCCASTSTTSYTTSSEVVTSHDDAMTTVETTSQLDQTATTDVSVTTGMTTETATEAETSSSPEMTTLLQETNPSMTINNDLNTTVASELTTTVSTTELISGSQTPNITETTTEPSYYYDDTGSTEPPNDYYNDCTSCLTGGAVAGIVIGVIVGLGLIVLAVYVIMKYRRQSNMEYENFDMHYNSASNTVTEY